METNQPQPPTPAKKQNMGTTSLVAGILQLIFGFSFSLLPFLIFIIAIITTSLSFSRKEDYGQRKKAVIGIVLCVLMVLMDLIFKVSGILGILLSFTSYGSGLQ
jgi:lipopolysaccharide export LptBFGC system permease protein LptF